MKKQTIEEACTLHARIGWQGLTKAEYLDSGEYYLVTGVDFADGLIDFEHCHYVTKDRYYQDEHIQLDIDDVLVTKDGTIGKVAIIDRLDKPATLNSGVFVVRPKDKENLLPEYLVFALRSGHFSRFIEQIKVGCTIAHLNQAKFLKYEIPKVGIEEQVHVIDVLKRAESVAKARQNELLKLDELIKARFVEMFGDPVSNSFGLPELTLPELGEFGRGVSKHRPRNDPALLGGKYPLIQTGEVAGANLYITSYENTYSELGLKQSKMWSEGTLCITIAANIAKTAILGFDACFPDSVVGFNANERTNNIYIHYWFSFFQAILEAQAPESAQKNINLKTLSELKVIVPIKEKQDEFVSFVKQVDKSKVVVQAALDKAQLLFDSLMQEYFG